MSPEGTVPFASKPAKGTVPPAASLDAVGTIRPRESASSRARNSVIVAGTPAARNIRKKRISTARRLAGAARAPVQEHELLEEVHVLLVLQERAVQRRDRRLRVVGAQGLRRDVLGDEQLDPV